MRFKTIGILATVLLISGCGNTAVYLRAGTVCVLEQPVKVIAAVPGEDGKLMPHTAIELPAGTEFRYGK